MNPHQKSIKDLIIAVRKKTISPVAAFKKLKDLPYSDMGFVKFDNHRAMRKGFPEVIYAPGKEQEHLKKIVSH